MNVLPTEIIEKILDNIKDIKEYQKFCKTNNRITSICQDDAKRKLKSMGYKISNANIDYISILTYISLLPQTTSNKDNKIISAFIGSCYENNIDIIKFVMEQDVMKSKDFKSMITDRTPEQLIDKCIGIAKSKKYIDIFNFLIKNK